MTTTYRKWSERTGLSSEVDYMRHLEAALRTACTRIADYDQKYEEAKTADDWFDYYLFESDWIKVIEK